jgi:hypothetical protein
MQRFKIIFLLFSRTSYTLCTFYIAYVQSVSNLIQNEQSILRSNTDERRSAGFYLKGKTWGISGILSGWSLNTYIFILAKVHQVLAVSTARINCGISDGDNISRICIHTPAHLCVCAHTCMYVCIYAHVGLIGYNYHLCQTLSNDADRIFPSMVYC